MRDSLRTSLVAPADALRTGALELRDYIDQLEVHFEVREPEVLAFLPEKDRFTRLRRDAEALAAQYPDAETALSYLAFPSV